MCTEHRDMTWTLLLLLLSGALCSTWKVEYQQPNICAVRGSSVVFQCSFYHPDGQRVQSVMWGHERNSLFAGPFIFDSKSPNTSRFQYIGDKHRNCSLNIHKVEHNDAGKYAFRFQTNSKTGQWTGTEGSTLKIVDLKAVVTKTNGNGATKEGDSVNLTCINGCDGGDLSSAFTWFKNGEPLNEGPVLYLSNVSSNNSGNYTCSLTTHTGTTSGVISIDVEYGPKKTLVSVRPSTEADAGSKATLICSSHANPPVENYTWFKMHDDGVVSVGNEPELHLRADEGQYMCNAANKHGSRNSSIVALKVKAHFPINTFTRDVFIATVVTALLIVTAVTAVRKLNRKSTRAPEADRDEDIQDAVYLNLPAFADSQSQEGDQCEGATAELIYAAVDFNAKRESNMQQQQMDSHNDYEGVIYSSVCSAKSSGRLLIKMKEGQHYKSQVDVK